MPLRQLIPKDETVISDAKVDIFAIHGLNPRNESDVDHAWDTWRTPAGPTGHLWLRDDLPDFVPEARIFLYQYNATVVYGTDRDTFIGKANELLEAIRIERYGFEDRSIILIGHSMGGLLIKQALINAHNNPKYTPVKDATTGLVFFATPHNGGDWTLVNLGSLAAKIAMTAGFKKGDDVMEVLNNGSVFFDIMQEYWRHRLQEHYDIRSFWGAQDNIVSKESARLSLSGLVEHVVKLNADHRSICKFGQDQVDKDNLKVVKANMRDVYENALKKREERKKRNLPPDESRRTNRRHCYIPLRRNHKFTGRSAVLDNLRDKLFVQRDCHSLAVAGLGGVGKTQVVLEFAYWVRESQKDYSILWVPASNWLSFEQGYAEIARRLDIRSSNNEEGPQELVKRHLESENTGRWFLIVDNADDEEFLFGSSNSESSIYKYLPKSENCILLFTTRSLSVARAIAGPDVVDLEKMSPEEATSLFDELLGAQPFVQDKEVTKELLEELTYLPLSIAQAAAYMNRNRHVSTRKYLDLLQGTEEDMVQLMSREFHDSTLFQPSQRAVATTWLVSFDQIRVSDKGAADLLSFMSCIEPKAIPRSVMPLMQTKEEMEHAIGTLCGYAFLVKRGEGEMFDMHRLVHIATRVWIGKHNLVKETTINAIRHLAEIFPSNDPSNRGLWREYLPHTLQVLHESRQYQIEHRYSLSMDVGFCLYADRRFKEAIKCFKEVCQWRERRLPKEDEDRLLSEHSLASAYLEDRQIKKAIKIFEHVVAVRKKTLNEEDDDRLASEHELAGAYVEDRRIKEAIKILEHVVAVWTKLLKEDDRLTSEHELARAYLADGRIEEAIRMLEHVVAVWTKTLSEENHSRLASEYELAKAYLENKRIEEAIKILEHVVAVEAKTLRLDDSSRILSLDLLADAYKALEDRFNNI